MKYRLTKNDIAMIAELRCQGVKWKHIARVYSLEWSNLRHIFNYRMRIGFAC